MRVNSVQNQKNYTKKQVNFGCDYCRLTKEMLVENGFVGKEVESVLSRVNPEDLGSRVLEELSKTSISPYKVHIGRAMTIYESLSNLIKNPSEFLKPGYTLKNGLKPGGLETLTKAIRDTFDDDFALRIGNDFNLYT